MKKSNQIFTHVRSRVPNTNTFDLSHDLKTSLNFGALTPVFLEECIPGDRWKIKSHTMLRFAPLVAPVMASVNVFTHYWFVPYRIMWDNWEKFITGGETGDDMPAFPTINFLLTPMLEEQNRLADYFGLKSDSASLTSEYNAMPFCAYQMIWYHWYRDENLQQSVVEEDLQLLDGVNDTFDFTTLRYRAWEHDYFTSALPFAQRGEQVMLPDPDFSVDTTISYDFDSTVGWSVLRDPEGNLVSGNTGSSNKLLGISASSNLSHGSVDSNSIFTPSAAINLDNSNKLVADSQVNMGDSARVSITELRTAIKLQEYLEKNARGGARYVEWLKNIFGVKSSDARLQLPEYIGGGKQSVVISEVLQTSETTEQSPQANMSGHGVSTGQSKRTNYYCEEHGLIIGIVSVLPRSSYANGIKRLFKKTDKFDYYLPQFAHIGEQELYNYELFNSGVDGKNNDVFGYMPRYIEYRFSQSRVTGEMRNELDFWNMARKFSNRPQLNEEFITMNPTEVSRVFADENDDYDKLYMHMFFQVKVDRRIARYGTPTI